MKRLLIPPIKSQGIKTKLLPWIKGLIPEKVEGRWVEPFMGTGVVGFNLAPYNALMCDINPDLIHFYSSLSSGELNVRVAKEYLQREGSILVEKGESHYYAIRDRFNRDRKPLDFLFLSRAGFNGMSRYNSKGYFNIPFCRKPQRFSQAYITKIINQIGALSTLFKIKDFKFKCQSFVDTILESSSDDILYCDPPYIGRHVDYYNGWNVDNEMMLFDMLCTFGGKFILSTWHHNDFRRNEYIDTLWAKYDILTKEHFYHVGGKEDNRNSVIEALVINFISNVFEPSVKKESQLPLFPMV